MNCDEILTWYRRHARPLPWRQTQDPYKIWVSEVMLQQTQVATVIPYYKKFLTQFPTLRALAKAPEQKVLSLWSGLGYYSRARNLRRGALHIIDRFGGEFPREREAALTVPGIGPYTAGAILSIAFNLPVPLVDGNVQRVFSRFYGVEKHFWKRAAELVQITSSPREFNQALMELGATVCTKANPSCDRCPISSGCYAKKHSLQSLLPKKKKRIKPKHLYWAPLVITDGKKISLVKNRKGDWWSEMWDLPRREFETEKQLNAFVARTGVPLQRQKHTVTTNRIFAAPVRMRGTARPKGRRALLTRQVALTMPISSLTRKILCSLGDNFE